MPGVYRPPAKPLSDSRRDRAVFGTGHRNRRSDLPDETRKDTTMKKLLTLTAVAALYSSTALAQDFSPAVQDAIQQLAREGFREVKVQRGPFGTRVKAEGNGIERTILILGGTVVSDWTEDDDDDDDDDFDDDDDDDDRSRGRDDFDDDDDDDDRSFSGSDSGFGSGSGRDDNDDDNDDDDDDD
jgi:opacity protein-like surface antigen